MKMRNVTNNALCALILYL